MARHLTANGVSGAGPSHWPRRARAGQRTRPGTRQQTAALTRLADLGAAGLAADGEVRWTAAMTVAAAVEPRGGDGTRGRGERTRLTMMAPLHRAHRLPSSFLADYFGQDYPAPAGNCDNDLGQRRAAPAEGPVRCRRTRVSERWGQARCAIRRRPGHAVAVDQHATVELFVPVVLERSLLRPA